MGALQTLQTYRLVIFWDAFCSTFITGYLLYSALFAAVGSAVDSETETQQFMFPITLPLLFTYILSVSVLFRAPDSPLAVWLSMIPFTAPVAMMVRIPFGGVPDWQLGLIHVFNDCRLFIYHLCGRPYLPGWRIDVW
jgi:ABC-2 type transport system permease protein